MSHPVYKIDWNEELRIIEPMMTRGGVVRVMHASDVTAWRKFDALLKDRFSGLQDATSVRIDHDWHTTRYSSDILTEFDRKLAQAGLPAGASTSSEGGNVRVLSDNEVSGDANFRIETLNVNGPSDLQKIRARDDFVADVVHRTGILLDRGGHLMVAVHHCAPKHQAAFWRDVWSRGFNVMRSRRLLLIHYLERGATPSWDAPEPDVEITLPLDLSDSVRRIDAHADLVGVLTGLGIERQRAQGMADAHVNSHKDSMSDFHNKLSSLIMMISREVDPA